MTSARDSLAGKVSAKIVLTIVSLLWLVTGQAAEKILSYHSDITIEPDGSVIVEETIRVLAEGSQIRRGIYRDFPTDYKDRFGNHYNVEFKVFEVTRGGEPEPWHTEKMANGVRVYAGSANKLLEPGIYRYGITYRTNRQLGFFEDHDELYWNVTGNGWVFPIEVASATVFLPDTTNSEGLRVEGYTGPFGSTGQDYRAEVGMGRVHIATTRPLGPYEGLTLVAMWPKGQVREPSRGDRLRWLLSDNRGLLIALTGLGAIFVYLYMVWSRYGRDPKPGIVFPHYEPPEGYSPASARFIMEMGYDHRTFTAAVINLAVNGHLEIAEDDGGYTLRELEFSSNPLAPGEKVLLRKLFKEGELIELDDKNHKLIGGALKGHKKALKRDYEKVYFMTNSPLAIPALLGLGLVGVLIAGVGGFTPAAIHIMVLTLITIIVFVFLLKAATPQGRRLMDKLEGFRMYMNVAEKDDLNLGNPPDKTPALFEKYLPFALALEVEQAWAEQFADVFARLQAQGEGGYQPRWYHGDFNSGRLNKFTSNVGKSLTTAIASSSTPPGSSSGGGGGGFSGGGGGGGGGGGW